MRRSNCNTIVTLVFGISQLRVSDRGPLDL